MVLRLLVTPGAGGIFGAAKKNLAAPSQVMKDSDETPALVAKGSTKVNAEVQKFMGGWWGIRVEWEGVLVWQ